MEKEIVRKTGNELLNETHKMLANLYMRWLDEREYEDFAEYEKVMKTKVAELHPNYTFVYGTKRPFGFRVQVEEWRISVSITMSQVCWKAEKRF